MGRGDIITRNLDRNFRSALGGMPIDSSDIGPDIEAITRAAFDAGRRESARQVSGAGTLVSNTGIGIAKTASSGIVYTQPQFFSPIHTPINWQIPVKRKECYQWTYLIGNHVLTEDFTFIEAEHPFEGGKLVDDELTGGVTWEHPSGQPIASGNGLFVTPLAFAERDCVNKLSYEFFVSGYYHSVAVTEEHGIYVVDGYWLRKSKKVKSNAADRRAKGIPANRALRVVIPNNLIQKKEAKDIVKGDYLLTPSVPFKKDQTLDINNAWLIGLSAADGFVDKTFHGRTAHITFSEFDSHLDCAIERLHQAFPDCLINLSHPSNSLATTRVTVGHQAHQYLSNFFNGKKTNKHFDKSVFEFSENEILSLLGGYFDGDGSFVKEQDSLVANNYSKDMADQIWWMLVRCGICASLTKHPLYGDHYPTNSKWCYRIHVPSSDVLKLSPHMKSGKIPVNFIPKKKRELKFFTESEGVRYLCQPIKKILSLNYTGQGYDMQIDPCKSYVLSGFKVSNCRYFYSNEPKVAQALEFHSKFPVNKFTNECQNRYVKHYFDKLSEKLKLLKWLRIISHEVHLLGDCFPFLEVECEKCLGSGITRNGKTCEHDGGSFKRLVILNPECAEVYSDPISPESLIAFLPNDELRTLIMKRGPGHERFSPEIVKRIMAGVPIPLDNRNVSHIKYSDTGYNKYGEGMVRRLFPCLAYKTKLMTAQWIIAERLILPIKVAKVGSDERPASAGDLADINSKLAQVANDPNLTLVTHHAFELDWFGAAGKIMQLTNEFEIISQEILDGLGVNKVLLNGEGPTYSSAAIGVEVMIDKLDAWRGELSEWVEQKIYLPIAKMKGFIEKNEWGEYEYVYPRIKWDIMHLRDQQQMRTFQLQLHEKGAISTQTMLKSFDIDYDQEVELLRYERAKGAMGGAQGAGGGDMGGGFSGGGPAGGGLPDLGGLGGDLGGETPGGAGDLGGAPGGDMGGGGGDAAAGPMASTSAANIREFGGKVLKKKSREKISKYKEKIFKHKQDDASGYMRDDKGRIMLTGPERELLREISKSVKRGEMRHAIQSQFPVKAGSQEYSIDFAMPDIKLGIEVDGALFHSTEEQKASDRKRDSKLAQQGWTILRFTDKEVENKTRQIIETIIKHQIQKESWMKQNS